jgi:hypothetical protein
MTTIQVAASVVVIAVHLDADSVGLQARAEGLGRRRAANDARQRGK